MRLPATLLLASLCLAACGDDDGGDTGDDGENPQEVITTVTLDFEPDGGGDAVTAEWDDPENDGSPVIDDIALVAGTTYTLSVGFENRLEDPPEIITEEVRDESAEHQVFLLGTAVDGPASDEEGAPLLHTYADTDDNDLPIGLDNTIVAAAGTGQLTVVLRHMPPVNDQPVKVADLADLVATGGVGELPGDTDVEVNFEVAVE